MRKEPDIIDVDFILVEDEIRINAQKKRYKWGLYKYKFKALIVSFVWCLIPFLGLIIALYLAVNSKRFTAYYWYGILAFFIFAFYLVKSV